MQQLIKPTGQMLEINTSYESRYEYEPIRYDYSGVNPHDYSVGMIPPRRVLAANLNLKIRLNDDAAKVETFYSNGRYTHDLYIMNKDEINKFAKLVANRTLAGLPILL